MRLTWALVIALIMIGRHSVFIVEITVQVVTPANFLYDPSVESDNEEKVDRIARQYRNTVENWREERLRSMVNGIICAFKTREVPVGWVVQEYWPWSLMTLDSLFSQSGAFISQVDTEPQSQLINRPLSLLYPWYQEQTEGPWPKEHQIFSLWIAVYYRILRPSNILSGIGSFIIAYRRSIARQLISLAFWQFTAMVID